MTIYKSLCDKLSQGEKSIAVLIDPEKFEKKNVEILCETAQAADVDFLFIGGSTLGQLKMRECISIVKQCCSIPVVIFPGNNTQIEHNADALLLLSLISGRNSKWLIGQHVEAAFALKQSGLELIPTGYILIDGKNESSVARVSETTPLDPNDTELITATALAGTQLGLNTIYLDAGSGAKQCVSPFLIQAVKNCIDAPLIVGGGIKNPDLAVQSCEAGADMIVIGNALEKDPHLLLEITSAVRSCSIVKAS